MGGFYNGNPEDTVVGSTDATEDTINENAVTETDSTSSFYRGSPEQTTVDGYVADAAGHATAASNSASEASNSESAAASSASAAASSLAQQQNLEITSASFDTTDGTLTLTKANSGTVTADLDGRFLTSYTEVNDLSTAVTWDNVPDNYITESSVTQHQSAINAGVSITESQISNLQSYLTSETSHADVLVDGDFTSNGFMKRDGVGLYSVDTNTYLTAHQDITGKANLSGADFTGDVTTTGDLGINTTNPAHPLDVKGNVNVTYGTDPIYTTSPLLTNASSTTYSIAEITDIYYASVRSTSNQSPLGHWDDNRRAVQILFNFNGTGHPTIGQKGWSSADQSVVGDFINDTYSSNDVSTFQSSHTAIFNGTYTVQTTIIDDILDGDYDHLVDYKVGINVDPATEALDVGGNIKASGTLATGGFTLPSTDGENGQALVTDGSGNVSFGDVTVDVSGKANLSGATFTGTVGIGSLGSPQTLGVYGATSLYNELNVTGDITATSDVSISGTLNTNSIESTINSSDYPLISIGQYTPVLPAMQIGGTESGNKIYAIEMRPAAGGVRMHWHQNTDNISGQTLRFHTTDRGVHVGDDRTGTYTAGDNQSNADIDFGMLVGRESANLGSNNFGFGYDIDFSVDTASNIGAGSLIDVYKDTVNSAAFGGAVRLGKSVSGVESGVTASFVGGNIARTQGDYSFTWAKGELDENGIYPAVNEGYGCVLFGHITDIDADSTWSMVGGDIAGAGQTTSINNTHYSLVWGKNAQVSNSSGAAVFGNTIAANYASYSLISGNNNSVFATSCVVGGISHEVGYQTELDTRGDYSACFGTDHLVEGRRNFVAGHNNNSLGESGACIGQGLKTPLFQPVGGGDYVWDDYSVVVGGYNAEATKYYTNTNNTAWVEDHRFVVGTGTASNAKGNGFIVARPTGNPATPDFCGIIMPALASSTSYVSASAAKAGGVPVGGLYRIGSDVKILLSTD